MRELKEQIQQMRKQLEAKMEEEGKRPDTPETPKDEHPPPGPLTGPSEAAEEQTKTTSPEEEQLNFDVSHDSPSLTLFVYINIYICIYIDR